MTVNQNEDTGSGRRLYLLYGIIALCMIILVSGLAQKQLFQKEDYVEHMERQNYRRIILPGPRGNIYDRDGRLLVGNRPLFSAVVYLNDLRREFREEYIRIVRDARERHLTLDRMETNLTARRNVVQRYLDDINAVLGSTDQVDSREIERHFRQSLLLPFQLKSDLSGEEYARLIEQVPIDSPVQILISSTRYYPFEAAAFHTLGYVSSSEEFEIGDLPGDDLLTFRAPAWIGRTGLEKEFNDQLQGETGTEIWTVDPGGFQYDRVEYVQPRKGSDLVTSLDVEMQLAAEKAMQGKTGAVVALDVRSGEVLTLASMPNYDLNRLTPFISFDVDEEIREQGGWINRATQGLYPPASTFKLITAMAGLRSDHLHHDTVINCPGYHRVGRRVFHCMKRSGHGDESLSDAIRDSCNVYFYQSSLDMGIDAIVEEARRFGLDTRTGIDVPGETGRMLVPSPAWKQERLYESWFDGDTANVSIGQGYLLVTPLQMATFITSVARGRTITVPTMLHYPHGRSEEEIGGEPIGLPEEDMAAVYEGMIEAGQTGTARRASLDDFPAAGKTGTAQVRKDGKPTTLAWYVGFAPADNPQVAIAVMIEGVPEETDYGGGSTAAPVAREVFRVYRDKLQRQQPAESPATQVAAY
ncbi:MAG: penicillin-binding protein 2 [Verrucomicrobiota bacterium JB022]|nr:penicillin-binding protein 2 [Verrucomicrobiota bacterium JB022]